VLYHDRTLAKVAGMRKRVCHLTTDELSLLDWGQWFHPDFTGERLLSLKDTLAEYASKTRLLIEIKSRPYEQRLGVNLRLTACIVQMLADAEDSLDYAHIYILSFDPQVLNCAHERAPHLNYVALTRTPNDFRQGAAVYASSLLRDLYAVCAPIRALDNAIVKHIQSGKRRVMTYACNTPAQMDKALSFNIDVIMTDNPKWLFSYCRKHQLLS
jgi:glycerophosphoryl diester phosphodiesterase